MHGKRQAARAATGGVLRSAVAASATPHRQRTNQDFCGWSKWTPASTASRSTPPAALSFRSAFASHKPSSSGRHPPLGGGRLLAHTPCPEYGPHRPNPIVAIHYGGFRNSVASTFCPVQAFVRRFPGAKASPTNAPSKTPPCLLPPFPPCFAPRARFPAATPCLVGIPASPPAAGRMAGSPYSAEGVRQTRKPTLL